ncbi:spore coat polysaccharide biosynthesis protein SpsF [Sporosarcina newyorkensis 2681]|uniref:Spore coat polysaccharide biosynthesis protein SpsF n=1 Tax=Sporosarcina newyorkensis 2681 TaxID=1027292 RepID=F9DQ58_9BACL|nr:glycosyltransferase family protein [Sporosarcina newyorkensis]EGQ27055.1 spore coat polysaccharide biosynthesis protein SpsF [Sporosarcina newyorkensis 2681]
MKTIVIIQARMGSTRLPGKIVKPLGTTDVLTYVTSRCQQIKHIEDVIVATSTLLQDDAVETWCQKNGVTCFRGSEEDVLDRFVQCAKLYNPDYVMRVTADCPFVDYELASAIVEMMEYERKDLVSLAGNLPRGLAVELLSYQSLLTIHEKGHEPRHREHVTYYANEYEEEFTRAIYKVPSNRLYPELRITLDTEEDYALCLAIANHFKDELIPSEEVIQFLLDHPEIAKLNAYIEQKSVK